MDKEALKLPQIVTRAVKGIKSLADDPAHLKTSIIGRLAQLSRKKQYAKKPDSPFFLGFLMPKKLKTKYNRFVRNVDENLGAKLYNPTKGKKSIFRKTEHVKIPGLNATVEHAYPSIMAPVGKTMAIATPIMGALYLSEKLNKESGENSTDLGYNKLEKSSSVMEDKMVDKDKILVSREELEKTAAALKKVKQISEDKINLEKTAAHKERAEKIAFTLVERGAIPTFKSYSEFQEKVASLLEENLDVVEKALEFNTQKISSIGTVSNRSVGGNALENFVLGDE